MSNAFTQHVLIYDGSAAPALSRHEHPRYLVQPLLAAAPHDQVFLASGFTSFAEDSSLPISPTLQLNGDLGTFSTEQLTRIARAELDRSTGIQYRSLLSQADPKVVVLGDSASALNRFTDTYGGVLEIDSLLTKGMDASISTASDIDIRRFEDRLQLTFMVRTPIDKTLCTYCGDCGRICPEHCLDEHLFLDLERCSFCKECISVCPTDAIDLYGAEKRTLETPALLLLSGTKIDLPKDTDRVFQEENLTQLFASIFSSRIDETVTCSRQLCQYSGRLGAGCDRCNLVCSHGAINRGREGIQVDQQKCVECGACIGICPTGAMQSLRCTDQSFLSYCKTISLEPGSTVVIGEESPLHAFWWHNRNTTFAHTFFMEHPVPGALTLMHFLFLLSQGVSRILILTSTGTATSSRRQIQQVNAIHQALFSSSEPVQVIQQDSLTEALKNRRKSTLPSLYTQYNFTNRKEKLVSLLHFFLEQSPAPVALDNELFSEFGQVNCDQDRCTLCSACVSRCHLQALAADSESFALLHTPSLCVQCGICVQICPENALTLQPGLILEADFFQQKIIAQAEPVTCPGCGKVFGTQESLTKVMSVLSAKNLWDSTDDLLKYCETCRVIQLFETEAKKS